MNKKENQRFLQTRDTIEQVFMDLLQEKDLNQITVSEICRKAGIHRTTFYGHYQDVYDLMDKTLRRQYVQIRDSFLPPEGGFSMRTGLLRLFEIVRENRIFFQYYLSHREIGAAVGSMFPELFEENARHMMEIMGLETLEELYGHEVFFEGGLSALVLYWCSHDCKGSPEQMVDITLREYLANSFAQREET